MGHASTFIAYDVLQRRLRSIGYLTQCVRNVTDVDDDLLSRARSLGVHYLDLAARSLAVFEEDMKALGLLPAHSEPR
ncbi:MAG: L-cysteine:1D-myo-inositol 2-amino-2-deoxy-alpha-D-glucopyranoside ligase, partial [Candidatus Poriferisodalaceae bacterium]